MVLKGETRNCNLLLRHCIFAYKKKWDLQSLKLMKGNKENVGKIEKKTEANISRQFPILFLENYEVFAGF